MVVSWCIASIVLVLILPQCQGANINTSQRSIAVFVVLGLWQVRLCYRWKERAEFKKELADTKAEVSTLQMGNGALKVYTSVLLNDKKKTEADLEETFQKLQDCRTELADKNAVISKLEMELADENAEVSKLQSSYKATSVLLGLVEKQKQRFAELEKQLVDQNAEVSKLQMTKKALRNTLVEKVKKLREKDDKMDKLSKLLEDKKKIEAYIEKIRAKLKEKDDGIEAIMKSGERSKDEAPTVDLDQAFVLYDSD